MNQIKHENLHSDVRPQAQQFPQAKPLHPRRRSSLGTLSQQIEGMYNDPSIRKEYLASKSQKYHYFNSKTDSTENQIIYTNIYPIVSENEQLLWLLYCHYSTHKDLSKHKLDISESRFKRPLLSVLEYFYFCKDFQIMESAMYPVQDISVFPLHTSVMNSNLLDVLGPSVFQEKQGTVCLTFSDFVKVK